MKKPGIFSRIEDASILDKEYVLDGSENQDEPLDKADAKPDLSSDQALDKAHGRKVFVYFNLHKKLWSVKDMQTGLVIAHAKKVAVDSPVFKVSEAGRQRVIAEQRKNVHAGVVGTLDAHHSDFGTEGRSRVSYNPYRAAHFYESTSGNPVRRGSKATLAVEEKVNPQGQTVRIPHLHVSDPVEKAEKLPGIFGVLSKAENLQKAIHELQPGNLIRRVRGGQEVPLEQQGQADVPEKYNKSSPHYDQWADHEDNFDEYDYTHLLPEGVRQQYPEFKMILSYHPTAEAMKHRPEHGQYFVQLKHPSGALLGEVAGIHDKKYKKIYTHTRPLNDALRNRRVGTAMYEAAAAHGHHLLGIKEIGRSPKHTEEASRTLSSFSRKHGLVYSPSSKIAVHRIGGSAYLSHGGIKIPRPQTPPKGVEQSVAKSDELPGIFGVLAKNEAYVLEKAIHELQPGKEYGEQDEHLKTYDYSHLIPENIRKEHGLQMHLTYTPDFGLATGNGPSKKGSYAVRIFDKGGNLIGKVRGTHFHDSKQIDTHAGPLKNEYRKMGLGTAMYEAALAHGYHHLGIRKVAESKNHTLEASRVHGSINRKHKLIGYKPKPSGDGSRVSHKGYRLSEPTKGSGVFGIFGRIASKAKDIFKSDEEGHLKPVQLFKISSVPQADAHFYIHSKGDKAGHPADAPSATTYSVKVNTDHLVPEFAKYLFMDAYAKNKFKQGLHGSVIPALNTKDVERIMNQHLFDMYAKKR